MLAVLRAGRRGSDRYVPQRHCSSPAHCAHDKFVPGFWPSRFRVFREQLRPTDGEQGLVLARCRWPGYWVECGEADDRAGGDRSRRALMPAETGPVHLPAVLSRRSESSRVGSRDRCTHGLGGRVTGSDAEGPVTMPEGTGVGADHQQSPPKNPVYGLAVGFGRGGTVVGVGWTVGSAISSSAKREAGAAGAAAG